ncbi:MAG: hypothetical protein JXB88_20590 [Spirochaetales bacterium]|nr:hypothetical protein [Spirochaetales bacterium]
MLKRQVDKCSTRLNPDSKETRWISALFMFCSCFFMIVPHLAADTKPEPEQIAEAQLLVHFSLNGIAGDIGKPARLVEPNVFEITVIFPYEINLENLIAEFETQENTLVFVNNVKQISGITANDFSVPVTYTLKQEKKIVQEYRVRVVFEAEFKMDFGASIHPSYNTTYGMVNIGYDGDFFIGGKFNKFLFGVEITDSYFVFNGQSGGENISGYWNILRGALANRWLFSKYWELNLDFGGGWMHSRFEFKGITRYIRNNPGFFLQFDVNFSPWKYMRIDFSNQFDLFMDTENGNPFTSLDNFYPYYKGGVQVSFLNFIKWLRIHFGISGLYSYYQKDGINTTMGMVVFDTGLHIDLQFPGLLKPPINDIQRDTIQKSSGTGIEGLKAAKRNDVIEFPRISFKDDSNILTEESLALLSEIVEVLTERKSMEILIKIFTKQTEDPVSLVSMAIEKLQIIKQILVDLGIEKSRIHIPLEVSILDDSYPEKSILIKIIVIKQTGE